MHKKYEARASARTARGAAVLLALISVFTPAATAQTAASAVATNDKPRPAAKPDANARPATAQQQGAPAKAPKQLKPGGVNVSGSLRLRAENYGWFETPGFEDEYTFGAAQLRLSLG